MSKDPLQYVYYIAVAAANGKLIDLATNAVRVRAMEDHCYECGASLLPCIAEDPSFGPVDEYFKSMFGHDFELFRVVLNVF